MKDNIKLLLHKDDQMIEYFGVVVSSREEAAKILHPSYWDDIKVGFMEVFKDGLRLIRFAENIMLIRKGGSRHFIMLDTNDSIPSGFTCELLPA